ncbi:MAG: UDP-glucose/GDP-mannose dehydrogenase family protein [SAR324 cluster bacterium]|nr:UDP-glucose/GDP-mannose dehydrogenase family protein [SAR324 cluster bacterium]
MKMKVSVIGLGKLGASMTAAIAKRGFDVIGVDVSEKAVAAVNAGRAPVQETDLEETIAANQNRIRATMSHAEAVLNSDISFVIVPTPSDERGAFSLQYASWAFKEIGKALSQKQGYHNVVMTSTVLPGSTRYGLLPILEHESGKKAGRDFGLCYSPEFIALGSIIHDFLNPDFNLVGEIDEYAGSQLEAFYKEIMENNSPCKRMSLENAELTKISVNTFVTTKISFANMLIDMCERIPGGDIDVVTDALGTDQRIGNKYLKGAIGYGGPCFPRDNVAFGFFARALESRAELAETTDQFNRSIAGRIVEKFRALVQKGKTVAILGLAYKPYSHVLEESQGVYLAEAFSKAGARVLGYDPMVGEDASKELHYALVLDSLSKCLEQAEIVFITNRDPVFDSITASDFKQNPVTVIDFWRTLESQLKGQPHIRYIPVGKSIDDEANASRMIELWGITPQTVLDVVV